MKRRWIAGLVVGMLTVGALAKAETARDILDRAKKVNDAREPKDVSQKVTMTLIDSRGGERVRDLAIYGKNFGPRTNKSITYFLSPPEVKGVGFLSWSYPKQDDDQWLFLPELKRVRQITSNTRRQSFQGSDFSYEDLQLFDDIRDWTEEDTASALLRDGEVADGVPCAVIELTPKGKDFEYGRFVLWLHQEDSTFRKFEFYDNKDGALLKVLTLTGFEDVEKIPTPHLLEMANAKKGTKTRMAFTEVKYNQGLTDELFTQRYLERGRIP